MYETFLHVFFWLVVTIVVVLLLAGLVLWGLANMMSDNASDNQPGPIERTFNRFMEWFSALLNRGKP